MRGRRKYLFLLVLAVAAVVVVFVIPLREPEYGGKSLSEWVDMFPVFGLPGDRRQAGVGIRGVGTNAIPYLLRWLEYEQPPWRRKFYAAVNGSATRLRFSYRVSDSAQHRRAFASALALLALGPEARGAVNELTHVMYDPRTTTSAGYAATVLDILVMKSGDRRLVPVLKEMLKDPNPKVRAFAAHGLRNVDQLAPEEITPQAAAQ